jgi:hypothetical protein
VLFRIGLFAALALAKPILKATRLVRLGGFFYWKAEKQLDCLQLCNIQI